MTKFNNIVIKQTIPRNTGLQFFNRFFQKAWEGEIVFHNISDGIISGTTTSNNPESNYKPTVTAFKLANTP